MPQLVKKRRSGWAILAAGALVASLLAVGASPAAADAGTADELPSWTACLGDGLIAFGFEDVAMGGAHYDNINCLAHYGITVGRSATEFAPLATVTRSQMSLFLSRSAAAVGIELSDETDHEFTDLGATGADRVAAIVALVNSGVMSGRSATTFDPLGVVTRADMAEHLVALVALARDDLEQDDDTLLYSFDDDLITAVDGETLRDLHDEENGFFTDVYTMASPPTINAIYTAFELGITAGYRDGTFKPDRSVSRQEMASFIMRAMAHTNLRPAGLSGQRSGNVMDGYTIQISMRDADFATVSNVPVDVFSTGWPEAAFDADGACVVYPFERVSDVQPSVAPCAIDAGDRVTDSDGNTEFERDSNGAGDDESDAVTLRCEAGDPTPGTYTIKDESPTIDADTKFYVFTGDLSDEVSEDTDLVEITVTSAIRPSRDTPTSPDHALVDGGLTKVNQKKVKFDDVITYTLQLRAIVLDADGVEMVVNSAPDKSENQYILTDSRTQGVGNNIHLVSTVLTPDVDGLASFEITHPNPTDADDDVDVTVSLTLTRAEDNTAATVDSGAFEDAKGMAFGSPLTNALLTDSDLELEIVFSEADAAFGSHLITGESLNDWKNAPRVGATSSNFVTVTVIDEYGDPVRGVSVRTNSALNVADQDVVSVFPFVQYYTTNRSGQYSIGYAYGGGPASENLIVIADDTPEDDEPNEVGHQSDSHTTVGMADAGAAVIHWAGTGRLPGGENAPVLVTEAGRNLFIVDADPDDSGPLATAPYVYAYDDVDTFALKGTVVSTAVLTAVSTAVSMEEFERAITTVTAYQLSWTGYDPTRPIDRSTWEVSLSCVGVN